MVVVQLVHNASQTDELTAANMGFGVMAALRICPGRYNATQRHINQTNKAQL